MDQDRSIYEYTPDQAELVRLYDLYRTALLSRKYHGYKLRRARLLSAIAETVAAITASSALATLAIWKTAVGGIIFTCLLAASAVASILRSAFRLSENLDHHSRLTYAWSEIALEMEQVMAAIRREKGPTDVHRQQIIDVASRFQRIELRDEGEGNRKLLERLQQEVDQAAPPERFWLPAQ